jgi:hypothetical protein
MNVCILRSRTTYSEAERKLLHGSNPMRQLIDKTTITPHHDQSDIFRAMGIIGTEAEDDAARVIVGQ